MTRIYQWMNDPKKNIIYYKIGKYILINSCVSPSETLCLLISSNNFNLNVALIPWYYSLDGFLEMSNVLAMSLSAFSTWDSLWRFPNFLNYKRQSLSQFCLLFHLFYPVAIVNRWHSGLPEYFFLACILSTWSNNLLFKYHLILTSYFNCRIICAFVSHIMYL